MGRMATLSNAAWHGRTECSRIPTEAFTSVTARRIGCAWCGPHGERGLETAVLVFCVQTRMVTVALCFWTLSLTASDFETIGLVTLRNLVPSLTGAGVVVALPEAGAPAWQVNPAAISQPAALFTWHASGGSETGYPNSLGSESWHANEVAKAFFGLTNGAAPGVAHADNYDANYFFNSLVNQGVVVAAKVVNQSFIFATEMPDADATYDNYAAQHGTIFLNGAGNGGAVSSPGSAYNVIAVGAYGGSSSTGPTLNGRCKPDVTAPHSLTSFSTPLVAGTATLLLQAGLRGDGGPGTSTAAANMRTIKALLLNGATKPVDWTNLPGKPLDLRYGAGVLHAWNSYRQLRGGRHTPVVTQTISVGSAHPPASNTNNLPTRRGWDFRSISHAINQDAVNHYFFDLSSAPGRISPRRLPGIASRIRSALTTLTCFFTTRTRATPWRAAKASSTTWSTCACPRCQRAGTTCRF